MVTIIRKKRKWRKEEHTDRAGGEGARRNDGSQFAVVPSFLLYTGLDVVMMEWRREGPTVNDGRRGTNTEKPAMTGNKTSSSASGPQTQEEKIWAVFANIHDEENKEVLGKWMKVGY